ncbi:MAG: glycosyltransferase [Pseudomonadales bacterium]|nr:glycosyltransferase [Pseudomonadales bacterium]
MNKPTVSVIIPSYNRGQSLPRALDSVLAQTRPAEEIIVVDDGSDDGTAAMLARDYPELACLVQENRGVSAARNTGIRAARGDWIALLDSDDEWLPQKLERQLLALQEARRSESAAPLLVHCDEIWIRKGRRVNPMDKHAKAGGWIFERCLPLCAISPSAVLMARELLADVGEFDEDLPACEDYDLWLRICSRYPVLYVDEPLLNKYGGHSDQLSRQHWGMDRFRVRALDKLLSAGGLDAGQQEQAIAMLHEKCRILRLGAEKRGNQALLDELSEVLQRHPE